MDFQRVSAVFEFIAFLESFSGKLARFSDQHDSGAELVGKRRADDKTPCLDTDYLVDLFTNITVGHEIDHPLVRSRIRQERRDVLEDNAFLGEIRYVTYYVFQIFHVRSYSLDFSVLAINSVASTN